MAMPKRYRDQLRAEGKTLEEEAKDVEEGNVSFGLNEAIANNEIPDALDDDLPSSDDYIEDAPQDPPAAETNDDPDPAPETDTKAEDQPEPAPEDTPTEDKPETQQYVNPFDIGLEDEPDPEPQPAPEPAPVPAVQQQQPAPAPVPQQDQPAQFQFTQDEIKALGGPQQAQILMGILSRFTKPQQEEVRRDLQQARLDGFRQNIAASVPQFREIVASKAWKRYLQTYSPLAGGTIQDALLAADSRLDRRAVIGIFEGFLAQHGQRQQPPKETDAGGKSRPKPADLATPGKSATNNGGVNHRNRRYKFKESDIAKFDDQRRRKRIDAVEYHDKVTAYEQALANGEVELGA